VIESYEDFLIFGESSSNELAKRIAISLTSPKVSKRTAIAMLAPAKMFLKLSEMLHQKLLQLVEHGLIDSDYIAPPLLENFNISRKLSRFEKKALNRKSMIAGVVSGGSKIISLDILSSKGYEANDFEEDRAFPIDRVVELIDSSKSYRDKTLWAALAATGGRISEVLQILWQDVNISERQIKLINPNKRLTSGAYNGLTPDEVSLLSWKGRESSQTMLIAPFADLFFQYLELYVKHEHIHHGTHEFIFQIISPKRLGKPLFTADYSSIFENFKRALSRTSVIDQLSLSPHSLRHMYGVYLLNYFPTMDGGFGLPLESVRAYMGHKVIESTKKYARKDKDLIAIELEFANKIMVENGAKSIQQIRVEVLQTNLERAKALLELEESLSK